MRGSDAHSSKLFFRACVDKAPLRGAIRGSAGQIQRGLATCDRRDFVAKLLFTKRGKVL
jgi:hypothetical protein